MPPSPFGLTKFQNNNIIIIIIIIIIITILIIMVMMIIAELANTQAVKVGCIAGNTRVNSYLKLENIKMSPPSTRIAWEWRGGV